jgi:hypothetical protein
MLDNNHYWLLATAMLSGLFWLIAYLLIIRVGFRDKTYGMPVVAFIGNFAWEIIYGLGLEPVCPLTWSSCPAPVIQARNAVWLIFDALILYTILKFGRRYFSGALYKYFAPIVLGGVAVAGLIIYFIVNEYYIHNAWGVTVGPGVPEFLPLTLQGGSDVTGFGLNLIMSILFIFMLERRGSLEGQSLGIAVSKWLGTLFAYGFMIADGVQTPLVNTLYFTTFLFDVYYIARIYRLERVGKERMGELGDRRMEAGD